MVVTNPIHSSRSRKWDGDGTLAFTSLNIASHLESQSAEEGRTGGGTDVYSQCGGGSANHTGGRRG